MYCSFTLVLLFYERQEFFCPAELVCTKQFITGFWRLQHSREPNAVAVRCRNCRLMCVCNYMYSRHFANCIGVCNQLMDSKKLHIQLCVGWGQCLFTFEKGNRVQVAGMSDYKVR